MGSETELKFQLDPVALQQLRRHPLLGRLKQEKARTRLEKSAYFDTAEGHLRAQGAVLRIRTIGRRRIQTLKTTDENAGAWSRNEWEWDIFDDVPDLRLLTDTPLAETIGQTNLQAVFSTEIRRTTYLLSEPGWTVELALDQGQVLAGPYSAPVTEAELELKSGDADHLFQLALSLTQNLSARLSLLTKAKRGFALLEQAPLTSSKARTISLDGAMNATAALRQIALSCIAHFVTNQDYLAMSGDPEAIHQMRVALRRLRAAMSLFKTVLDTPQTQEIRQDLRWLQSHLGPARDAEVFVREILDPVTPVFAEVPGFSELRQQFIARQQGLLEMARALPEQPRFTQTLLSLSRWAEGGDWLRQANQPSNISNNQTVSDFARTALTKRDRQIGKAMLRLDKMAESERHELRIKIKKLRYSIDFFGSIFHANRAKRSSVALGLVQDRLGLLNDIAVAHQILQRQADENGTVQSSWVAGMIAGWHSAQTKELLRQAGQDWKGYARLPRFWTED